MNNDAIIWLIAAAVLGVVEVSTVNLITLWFAVSALITAVFAALGAGPGVQITVFVVVSAILVIATRPLATRSHISFSVLYSFAATAFISGVMMPFLAASICVV